MAIAKTSLEHWAVLVAVVDEGGFQQAARKLHRRDGRTVVPDYL